MGENNSEGVLIVELQRPCDLDELDCYRNQERFKCNGTLIISKA